MVKYPYLIILFIPLVLNDFKISNGENIKNKILNRLYV